MSNSVEVERCSRTIRRLCAVETGRRSEIWGGVRNRDAYAHKRSSPQMSRHSNRCHVNSSGPGERQPEDDVDRQVLQAGRLKAMVTPIPLSASVSFLVATVRRPRATIARSGATYA